MVNKTQPSVAPVPPEEEVPPLTSSCCDSGTGGGGGGGVGAAEGDFIDNCDAAAVLMCDAQHNDNDDNLSSWSLQRQVDDLFDRYWLSPNTVEDKVILAVADFAPLLQGNKSEVEGSITAALSFPELHHSIDSTRGAGFEESKDDGSLTPSACDSSIPEACHPTFRVVLLTSSSTVTVELVADDASWSSSHGDYDSDGDKDGELKAAESGDATEQTVRLTPHRSKKRRYSRRVWLVPADDDDDDDDFRSSKDIYGIEVIPRKHRSDDGSGGLSSTCTESSDETSFSRSQSSLVSVRLRCVERGETDDRDEPGGELQIDDEAEVASIRGQPLAVTDEDGIDAPIESTNREHDPRCEGLLSSHATSGYVDGCNNDQGLSPTREDCINEVAAIAISTKGGDTNLQDTQQDAGTSSTGAVTKAVEEELTERIQPESDHRDFARPDCGLDDSIPAEKGLSLLDASEETVEERLEDAILLSFTSSSDVGKNVTQNSKPLTLALVESAPAKTTARRVRSLLNGMFELEDSDGSAAAGVKNVVQRIEEKMVVRRRTVTGNRHFKVSRPKTSDDASDDSHSTGSEKAMDPVKLTCRLILRLASSDSESDGSTSEDSSTTVTGSYVLSAGATNMTQGAESKQMEDVKSFVMMFRQLKAVETRQERWERRFQHIHTVPVEAEETGEKGNNTNGQRVAARCNRIAERLKEISGRQVVVPDNRERKRLEAEYRRLEKQLEEYGAEYMLSQIHDEAQRAREAKWEDENHEMNRHALASVRRYMPVHVRTMTVSSLSRTHSPNGKVLPENVARKFKVSATILQLLRIDPQDIERMHPSVLEDLRMVDLTLVERRALHCHLKGVGEKWAKRKAGIFTERRWAWFQMLKSNFKEELALHDHRVNEAETDGSSEVLSATASRSCALLNPESDIDYSDDYGFPEGDEYEMLTTSMQKGELADFASTLNELRKTDINGDADDVDFFGPIIERMKGLDEETAHFQSEIATLEDTIRSLGICHNSQTLVAGQEISSSESSSSESIFDLEGVTSINS